MRWEIEELNKLVENYQYKTNSELSELIGRSKNSIVSKLNELGLKKPKDHKSKNRSKTNKRMGRDLNKELIMEISSKYKSKSDFKMNDNSAYNYARSNGILEEACEHMTIFHYSLPQLILKNLVENLITKEILYNTRKIISPYEIDIYLPDYNIGFEYNGKYWHNNKDTLYRDKVKLELCKSLGIKLFVIIEEVKYNTIKDYENSIKRQFIEYLNEISQIIGYNISKEDVFNSDISVVDITTKRKLLDICNSYTHLSDFRRENKLLYNRLYLSNNLKKYTSHMIKLKNQYK